MKPWECIVIEDASTGLKAAKGAGMTAIVIPNTHTRNENFYGADLIVNSAKELAGGLDSNSKDAIKSSPINQEYVLFKFAIK